MKILLVAALACVGLAALASRPAAAACDYWDHGRCVDLPPLHVLPGFDGPLYKYDRRDHGDDRRNRGDDHPDHGHDDHH